MAKKLTCNFVKSKFEKEKYIPKFTEYINNEQKLNYICPNDHKHSVTWGNWSQGKRCPNCAGQVKPTIGFIRQEFEKCGYKLLSKAYKNAHTKLYYICHDGHKHSISWNKWQQCVRCPSCAGNTKLTLDFIRLEFEKEGYTLLEDIYINSKTKIRYICPNGHEHSITWGNWNTNGDRCPHCAGNAKLNLKAVKLDIEAKNYKLIDEEYINSESLLTTLCSNNHEYKISWNNWSSKGYRCPKCSGYGTSNFEKEVKRFTIDQSQEIIENDRTTIMGNKGKYLELDILLPCKTKAIECNGVYWHNRPEAIEKDKIKNKKCKELGINLLTITDDMWYNDRKKSEKTIKDFINV